MIETKISKNATSVELSIVERSQQEYLKWRAFEGDDFQLVTVIQSLQIRLLRWEVKNFGVQHPWSSALGIVEEVGELESASDLQDPVGVSDAIGDVLIYASNLCSKSGLDFDTLVSASFDKDFLSSTTWATTMGEVCHVALKQSQGIRGYHDKDVFSRDQGITLVRFLVSFLRICSQNNDDAFGLFACVAEDVMTRDWTGQPITGRCQHTDTVGMSGEIVCNQCGVNLIDVT